MRKTFTLALMCALAGANHAFAGEYITAGNGQAYTMATLAAIDGSGVTSVGDGVYAIADDITISEGDSFSIAGATELRLADGVSVSLCGYSDMAAEARVLVTRNSEADAPRGIFIEYEGESTITLRNIDFEYASLKGLSTKGFDVADCSFRYSNGKLSPSGALSVGSDGATFNITGCVFEYNEVPAIGGAANHACGLYIADCTFVDNNTANTNKPQLNLTVGGDQLVTIKDCTITGTGRNMVGGIALGNLMVMSGENKVVIEGCNISENRYGITGVGPMNMIIRDNMLLNNNHETNAMNGGSGISLAGYGYGLNAIVSGNHIENSLWGITIISCDNVNLGEVGNDDSPGNNVFVNNGNNGVQYDLYNNQKNTVYAQNNTWSVPEQTAELIETVIYHKADDASLGEVIFMPAHQTTQIADAKAEGIAVVSGTIISNEPVSVYDSKGRCVINMSTNPTVKHLPAGIYIAVSKDTSLKFKR